MFEQGFGPHIDLIGEAATFTMRVYNEGIKQFDYSFSDIPLDGFHLPIVAGRSREGWEVYDMIEHPQLLIAGNWKRQEYGTESYINHFNSSQETC